LIAISESPDIVQVIHSFVVREENHVPPYQDEMVTQPQNSGLPLPLIKRCSKLHGANRLSDAVKLLESWAAGVKIVDSRSDLSNVEFQQEVAAAYHPQATQQDR